MRAGVNGCSIVCNPKVLAGKVQSVTPLRGVPFPLGGNATEVRLALAVAVPPVLFALIWRRSFNGQFAWPCMRIAVAA